MDREVMRAVVFGGDGLVAVRDRARPKPEADEVLIQVEYCGVCGTDLHAELGFFAADVTMGHEFAGVIAELGSDVEGWSVGDRVTVNPNGDWCGECEFCLRGDHTMCARIWTTAPGLARDGGMAEFVAVRARMLYRLPDSVSTRQGAWVEPLAVALRAVRRSGVSIGDDAVVFGAGAVGQLVVQLLAAAGLRRIRVVEPSVTRRAVALAAGAAEALDPADAETENQLVAGGRPGFAFESSGAAPALAAAVRTLAPRGVVTMTGLSSVDPAFAAKDLVFKEIDVRASFIYDAEFEDAISVLASGRVDIEPLVSETSRLDDAVDVFDRMRNSAGVVKILFRPGSQV
jgi:threonine dehydrogenase-like Zn-dependent dehydrogenase